MRRSLALALGLVLLIAAPAQADHAGVGWRSRDITIVTNVLGTGMEPYLRQAVAAWDVSPAISLTVGHARNGNYRYNGQSYPCKVQRGVATVCAAVGAGYAFTLRDYSGGYLSMAFAGLPYTEYLSSSICHEIGHALGLEHTADHDSCMYSWETDGIGGPQTTHPSAHDFEALAEMYS